MSECSFSDETELEGCLALAPDDGRPLTGGTNLLSTVVDWPLQVAALRNPRNLAHDFDVKLNPMHV